jgi:hypothetical protein
VCQRVSLWSVLLCVACSSNHGEGNAEPWISVPEAGPDHAVEEIAAEAGPDHAIEETAPEAGPDNTVDEAGSGGSGGASHEKPDSGAPIECGELQEKWRVFVQANRGCSSVNDCIVVGGAGTCDCGFNLGQGSGDAIAKNALERSSAYFTRYNQCKAAGHVFGCIWDAAPHSNLRCESGLCTINQRSCLERDSGGVD